MKTRKDIFKNKRKIFYNKYCAFLLLKNNYSFYKLGTDGYIRCQDTKVSPILKKFYSYPKENLVTLEVNKPYQWYEIYKLINKQKDWWKEYQKSLYYTAPKSYRKKENKKFKRRWKRELEKYGENSGSVKYKKNGSWYY